MKLEAYEIQIGDHWHTVRGFVNPKGWLEWKDSDGAQGLKRPGTFRRKVKKEKQAEGFEPTSVRQGQRFGGFVSSLCNRTRERK